MPPHSLGANKGIFLNTSTARKVVTDLKYCNEKMPLLTKELSLCDDQVSNLKEQKVNLVLERDGLRQDKKDLSKAAEDYKDKYVATAEQLNKSEASKPSRLTWYGAGFITALIVVLAGAFAIK